MADFEGNSGKSASASKIEIQKLGSLRLSDIANRSVTQKWTKNGGKMIVIISKTNIENYQED